MVETSRSLHNGVEAEGKNLRNGRKNRRTNHRERETVIDPDYQLFALSRLREAERNDLPRNQTEKKRLFKKRFVETNQDHVLPPVPESDEINDRGKRQRVNVVDVDVDDDDPEILHVLDCLKEYGNAYALDDEDNGLIIYEEECSSDDVSERNSPRETRTNRGKQTNVNSIDENPRVGLVVESVNKGMKGILRKRKNDGPACRRTADWVAVQVNSREVLNQKRIKFAKDYFEKKPRKLLKEKNVVRKEVVEEEKSEDEEEEADDDDDDEHSDDDDNDYDASEAEDNSDYDDAFDYDDDCDDDYNCRLNVDKEYSLEKNLRKKSKGKNKKDLNRRCSPIYNLVMEDERPRKSNKMDKGKNVVSEVNEAKTKPSKWFKQDHMGSIGPSRPHRQKIGQSGKQLKENVKQEKMDKGKNVVSEVNEAKTKPNKWFKQDNMGSIGPSKQKIGQSGKQLKENVKQKKILKIAVEERDGDADYDEIEMLDRPEVRKGSCFVTDRNDADDSNGCADYRRRVLLVLNEPYDPNEYHRLFEEVNVYCKTFPDLKRKLTKYRYWPGKRLPILRGFFYWLQKSPHDGVFKPWKDGECLSVNLKTSKA